MGNDKDDLTRIEDLSEYLHTDDPETEAALENNQEQPNETEEELDTPPEFSPGLEENTLDDLTEDSATDLEIDEIEDSVDFTDSFDVDDSDLSLEGESSDEDDSDFSLEEDSSLIEDIEEDENEEDQVTLTDNNDNQDFSATELIEEVVIEEPIISETPDLEGPLDFGANLQETADLNNEPLIEEKPPLEETKPFVYKERENFQEIRNFGNNLTYGTISTQANPPFSILIENIKSKAEGEYYISILREHGLVDDQNEPDFKTSLEFGRLLVTQISEYSAIYLAHKFRKYPSKLKMGLADDIHPSDNYEDEGQGNVSTQNINQNTFLHQDLSPDPQAPILLSTSLTLENYFVEQYLDILTVEKTISEDEFLNEDDTILQSEYYRPIIDRLKEKARNMGANGVVGVDFQHTYLENRASYKILCTGNAVHLKLKD